ncbi:MAG: hypothetical protein ACK415_08760 [Thermodesulfovibrionales bacterium]
MSEHLIGKIVEVTANDITYRGRLVEMGETEVYLESDLGWIVIPVEQIASMREALSD